MTTTTGRIPNIPNPQFDHYRCPTCDHSALRGYPADEQRPGIYREGYRGPWFACPDHGIVHAKFYNHRPGEDAMWSGDDDGWADLEEAIDLLIGIVDAIDLSALERAAQWLLPYRSGRHERAMEDHCFEGGPQAVSPSGGFCSVCGRYWQELEGVWFRGARLRTPANDS